MPLVDRVVADRLPLEVVRDRPDLEPEGVEQVELALYVGFVVPAVGVEVVAPAGDLETVVAPAGGELRHFLEREVGPLAGEQGDRASHAETLRLLERGPGSAVLRAALDRGEGLLDLDTVLEGRFRLRF